MRIGIGLGGLVVVATALCGLSGCAGDDTKATGSGPGTVTAVAAMATGDPSAAADAPVVTHSKEREEIRLPYRTTTRKTATLAKGVTKVARQGRAGLRVKVFRLTLEDGAEVDRELVADVVKRKPVNKLVLQGTRVAQPVRPAQPAGGGCDSHYGGCVPIASDVDCAGGSGDGPKYAAGPVKVLSSDVYDLDADGDGWGCD
jgi:hypothetical protein